VSDDGAQPLYEVLVRHTTLGLDLASRLLHKFSSHLYTNHVNVDQLLGGADAACRLQKMADTVLEMDKSGRCDALSLQYPV